MLDHFHGNGKAMLNWGSVWRNWERRVPAFAPAKAKVRDEVQPRIGGHWQLPNPLGAAGES